MAIVNKNKLNFLQKVKTDKIYKIFFKWQNWQYRSSFIDWFQSIRSTRLK